MILGIACRHVNMPVFNNKTANVCTLMKKVVPALIQFETKHFKDACRVVITSNILKIKYNQYNFISRISSLSSNLIILLTCHIILYSKQCRKSIYMMSVIKGQGFFKHFLPPVNVEKTQFDWASKTQFIIAKINKVNFLYHVHDA